MTSLLSDPLQQHDPPERPVVPACRLRPAVRQHGRRVREPPLPVRLLRLYRGRQPILPRPALLHMGAGLDDGTMPKGLRVLQLWRHADLDIFDSKSADGMAALGDLHFLFCTYCPINGCYVRWTGCKPDLTITQCSPLPSCAVYLTDINGHPNL